MGVQISPAAHMIFPSFKNELKGIKAGYGLVVGCDEVGRGPVAGPVVAAACILDPQSIGKVRSKNKWYFRVRDSKTIPEKEREFLAEKILRNAVAHGIGIVWQEDIDKLNIHQASLLAMRRAVLDLAKKINKKNAGRALLLIDGRFTIPDLKIKGWQIAQKSVIDGDALILTVAAASIIAKARRDGIMRELDAKFPKYGFIRHKGYNTREHQRAIRKFGASEVHRKSFVK